MLDLFPSLLAGPFGRRLKRERGAKIPVTVITGFLGAGKTTLLKRFLAAPEGEGTAVIVNEFGAVGIDDALVRDSADETVLLGNGCVCCITRTDLQAALRRLVFDRERGTVPPFGRVVIETSGLADPGPILQTFSTDRALGGEFHIDVVLTVVDAVTGAASLDGAAEARKQVILADRLVISKTDLADTAAVESLKRRLQRLNPRASIEVAVSGALDPQRVVEPAAGERSGFVAEAAHSDGVTSFVITEDKPIEWLSFARVDGNLDRAARRRSAPREGDIECRRLQGAGCGAIRPAPRASAGRAGNLAGPEPAEPHRFHHPRYRAARRRRAVRRGAGARRPLALVLPRACFQRAGFGIVFESAEAAAGNSPAHGRPHKNAGAHMEERLAMATKDLATKDSAQKYSLNVNGKVATVEADEDMPLLYALRDDLGLNNPHFGCGLAQCGACTVHLDGQPTRSCITPVSSVGDSKITTLAGLGTPDKPHPLQTAYIEEQVPQCGYCINGWIMTAAAFLRDKKKPSDAEIKTALQGLKCRCGTHMAIMRAVKRAAEMMG